MYYILVNKGKNMEVFMRILLLDNAIDSFQWSLRHLRSFLEKDNKFENPDMSTTYLKQAIISLNTALELFFKAKISEINPLFIYEHISTDNIPKDILEYYTKIHNGKIQEPLHNYIISNSNLHTIEYSKCIDLFCELYSIPAGRKEDFCALNSIRNKLVHLGINSQSEYYIIAGKIANILLFIQYEILRNLEYDSDFIQQICCDILDIEFTFASLEDGIWSEIKKSKIEIICKQIERCFKSKEISDYMIEKNIIGDFGFSLDMQFSYASFTMLKDDHEYEMVTIYSSPQEDSLIVCDTNEKNGPVYGAITLSKEDIPKKFYLSNSEDGIEVIDFCNQGEFWKKNTYNKSFAYVPYGNEKIIQMIKQIINFMSTVNFVPNNI